MNRITKMQLANALFATSFVKGSIKIGNVSFTGISSVQRESGNGHTFNVTGYNLDGKLETIFCETID